MRNPNKITYDQMMKELDKHRGHQRRGVILTDKQINFLKTCREHPNPVTYEKMTVLWIRAGWGKISENTIRKRYVDL